MTFVSLNTQAEEKTYKMVFVPASEKGDESDYTNLISITEKLTGFKIETIKVTDYNAAVEAMRAGRAHIAWYGGKTYVKAAEIANAEAFAAGVRPGERDAGYFTFCFYYKECIVICVCFTRPYAGSKGLSVGNFSCFNICLSTIPSYMSSTSSHGFYCCIIVSNFNGFYFKTSKFFCNFN